MQGLAGRAGALGSALQALGPAGLAVGASVGAAVAGITTALERARQAIAELDRIDDVAARIGVGVEALQELQFIADQTNVSTQTLEIALQRLGRRIGTVDRFLKGATSEGKGFSEAFQELGISINNADGSLKTIEQILPELADAFASVGDQTTRLTLAQKLLDSEGVALLQFLQNGSEGLADMAAQARDLGIVFDESLVKSASVAQDELSALDKQIQANFDAISLNLQPALVEIKSAFAAVSTEVRELSDALTELGGLRGLIPEELTNVVALARRLGLGGFLPEPGTGTGLVGSPELGGRRPGQNRTPIDPDPSRFPPIGPNGEGVTPTQRQRNRNRGLGATGAPQVFGPGIEEFERAQAETERFLDRIREANLRANNDIVGLIRSRQTESLAALETMTLSEEEAAEARKLINETAARDIEEANKRVGASATKAADESTLAWQSFSTSITQDLARMALQGDLTVDSLIQSFTRLATDQAIQGAFSLLSGGAGGGGGGLASLLGLGGGSSGSSFGFLTGTNSRVGAGLIGRIHSGGKIGRDPIEMVRDPGINWGQAPRLHSGLRSDEFPAILQTGETVIPRGGPGAMRSPSINVVVNNNAGANVRASESDDGLRIDIDAAIASAVQRPGSLSNRAVSSQIYRSSRRG